MSKFDEVKSLMLKKQKHWLVTGCAGFIGSHISLHLLKLNQKVTGLDNFITGHRQNLNDIKSQLPSNQWKNFNFIEGDIRSPDTCNTAVKKIDFVSHQAALGSVPRSIKDPMATNDHNINGFVNMINAAKNANVKAFVYASSSSVYGDHPTLPKIEPQIGKMLSPYAVTKYTNELYANVFLKNYDFPVVGLRYFNVFGARQDPSGPYAAVIPLWVASLIKGEELFINGDGSTSRDFCYVDNAVQANILAANCSNNKAYGEAFNVACGERTTLLELYNVLKTKLQNRFPQIKNHKPTLRDFRAGDIQHSLADISKARHLLGYEPTHNVTSGLDEALNWYIDSLAENTKKSA
ncbi:MAG: Vi polysaccharide biosynthesis protein VipB/TviC [Proteobacteria bacterium SG_bin7]|nr:MAG: Vi polysaccharide biosynthesis protein VipB/TviC [Proteobacteria bacterium SG_bin7]